MKKISLTLIVLFLAFPWLMAQELTTDVPRYIAVTGSAEINVQPDEIELEIILKEYGDRPNKVDIHSIENEFLYILEKNKIPHEKVLYDNSSYQWYYWWGNRHEYYKQKIFTIKLDQSTDFITLMKDLDKVGVSSLRIVRTTSKKLQELRKEVKIQAVQAAKDKASYLLESIGEKPGRVIAIDEVAGYNYSYGNIPSQSNVSSSARQTGEEIENLATIKLRFEIKAKFEIAE